jgi:PAS domain S-box-containing protein
MSRFHLWLLLLLPVLLRAELAPATGMTGSPGRFAVLVIYADGGPQPGAQLFDVGLHQQLEASLGEEVEVYTEYLGLDRFSGAEHEQNLAEHLRNRYRERALRVIVAVGSRALEFVRRFRGAELPDVPVVFGGVRQGAYRHVDGLAEYGLTMELATRPMVELMLKLHPHLREIVIVSGASFVDGRIEEVAQAELAPLAEQVALRYWSGLPLPDLLNQVRKLPPTTAIFFLSCFTDGRGVQYTSNQVARQICNAASVPVYGLSSTYIGRGVVGVLGEQYDRHGAAVGRLVAGILQGHPPSPGANPGPAALLQFDAEEIARWNIDPRRLPAAAVMVNAPDGSLPELHFRFIIALTAILLLAALVIILLVNRERLRRAEDQLKEQLRFEQLTSGLSATLINVPPERMDEEIARALEKVRSVLRIDRCILFEFHAVAQLKRITHRAEPPDGNPLPAVLPVAQLPWFFQQLQAGGTVSLVDAARDLPASAQAERIFCQEMKLRSILIMPLRQGGQLVRWIGFYTTAREQIWPPELASRLHVLGDIFVSALAGAQAELALRHSEQLNRDILSSLNEQVALVDRTGAILSVNQAWYRFLEECNEVGRPVIGSNYLETCRRAAASGSTDAAKVLAGLEGVLRGTRGSFDLVYSSAIPGSPAVRWFRLTVTPFNPPLGGAVVMHSDVTEQQRLNEALRQSEERYREVVESQTELVCRYRGDCVLTFVNEAYCRFFSRSRASLLGRPFLELVPEAAHAGIKEQIALMCRDRQVRSYEHEVLGADGSVRWQQWMDFPILDERGEIEEFQAVGRDITDRKRAEEANRNLAHAGRLAVAGELTASIAHEINQPLGAILSNADAAEMLLERPEPPLGEVRQILADIRRDDLRASDVIQHLRTLLRKHSLEIQRLDLNELITEVLRLAATDGQRRRVQFVRELAPDLPQVMGDRVHLQQVLLNLLLNAMDAMAETPIARRRVTLRTRQADDARVEVAVIDCGSGVDPERIQRIFDSFFTTKREGMGLGLSIARSIIREHHGTLAVVNNPAGGATFAFVLPAAKSAPGVTPGPARGDAAERTTAG